MNSTKLNVALMLLYSLVAEYIIIREAIKEVLRHISFKYYVIFSQNLWGFFGVLLILILCLTLIAVVPDPMIFTFL